MSVEQRNATGGGPDGATGFSPFNDGLQLTLFIAFWVVALSTGAIVYHLMDDDPWQFPAVCLWGFLSGTVASVIVTALYIQFIYQLPIEWQRPYYRHWKKSLIRRAKRGVMHPFVDHHMLCFIQAPKGLDYFFEQGGVKMADRALNAWFNRVMESTEFALVMAQELSMMMPEVPITVVSIPPRPKPPDESYKDN